jgi:rhamnose utilization protein RhaD (predicted bifunctional aldolase and dehydrogenase)
MKDTDVKKLLEQITILSHDFGTDRYVCGGGGNTSVKNETILWVKPSGTILKDITPDDFVGIDRHKLSRLYEIVPPDNACGREKLVKDIMTESIVSKTSSRASVEAPLHDSLSARFVVHTHPAIVNGMTCSKKGASACKELFCDALWIDYVDPGYTLCMKVRQEIKLYKQKFNKEPEVIFLKNHGVFVAADSPEEIKEIYGRITETLSNQYQNKGISQEIEISQLPQSSDIKPLLCQLEEMFEGFSFVYSGGFDYANGPISPDHIVYSKSYPFVGKPTQAAVNKFKATYGYLPQVIVWDKVVFGIGQTDRKASLSLELFKDGALVKQLAEAFGGIFYMTDSARTFIENWEVESYRSKQM